MGASHPPALWKTFHKRLWSYNHMYYILFCFQSYTISIKVYMCYNNKTYIPWPEGDCIMTKLCHITCIPIFNSPWSQVYLWKNLALVISLQLIYLNDRAALAGKWQNFWLSKISLSQIHPPHGNTYCKCERWPNTEGSLITHISK